MAFLLDTTVLIDIAREHEAVSAWFAGQDLGALWLSTITVGELHRGIHQRFLRRPKALAAALGQLREDTLLPFEGRILGLDIAAAEIWGRFMGEGAARGRTPPTDDAKIAAIAVRHGLTVVSSNPTHLAALVTVLDPRFSGGPGVGRA
jgi:predicted nucleic acid-binding protein